METTAVTDAVTDAVPATPPRDCLRSKEHASPVFSPGALYAAADPPIESNLWMHMDCDGPDDEERLVVLPEPARMFKAVRRQSSPLVAPVIADPSATDCLAGRQTGPLSVDACALASARHERRHFEISHDGAGRRSLATSIWSLSSARRARASPSS